MTISGERTAAPPEQRPRAPGWLFAGVAMVIVVLVGALAVSLRETAPPTIAEYAPQAVEQVTAESEPAERGAGDRLAEDTTAPPAEALRGSDGRRIDVVRARACVGDPPRQTEDPQSPPCVPYWEGDNGGATAKGVTADQIRVALPLLFLEDEAAIRFLADHFNFRYEMYGRKIKLQTYSPNGNLNAHPNPAAEHADAVKVATELDSFASLGTGHRYGAEHHYYDELARRGVLSSSGGTGALATEERLRQRAPYQWSVGTATAEMLLGIGRFTCAVLADRPPSHAGGAQAVPPKRVFGLIVERATDGTAPDVAELRRTLENCGSGFAREIVDDASPDATRNGTNAMLAMRDAGVTSVVCLCASSDTRGVYMPAASGQGYQPEWIVSTYGVHDTDNAFESAPPEQAAHAFGISYLNKWLPRGDNPWYWALKEVAPGHEVAEGSGFHLVSRYTQLLLLASGIQMAGPRLTAEAFEAGLHRARFPNPGGGGPRFYQARVGFEGRRHTMFRDAAMFWYSRAERSTVQPTSNVGAVCYVRGGTRYRTDEWGAAAGADEELFTNCR